MTKAERLRALARVAAAGQVPSIGAVVADHIEHAQWRMAVSRLRAEGLLPPAGVAPTVGAPAPLWPGPARDALVNLIGEAAVAAWEAARDRPSPDGGWVYVGGEVRRVVDGVALSREIGVEDVRLLRGGVAVGEESGRMTRWEVVDA